MRNNTPPVGKTIAYSTPDRKNHSIQHAKNILLSLICSFTDGSFILSFINMSGIAICPIFLYQRLNIFLFFRSISKCGFHPRSSCDLTDIAEVMNQQNNRLKIVRYVSLYIYYMHCRGYFNRYKCTC